MFISTRDYNHIPYRHIVLASVSKTKKLLNLSKINFVYFKPSKTPSVKYLFFLIKLILNGSLFLNNRANIKYENVKIGRFVLAETYKNYDSYLSRIKFYFYFIKNLYRAGKLIYSAENYDLPSRWIACTHLNICFVFWTFLWSIACPHRRSV